MRILIIGAGVVGSNLAEGKECCGFYICKKNLKWDK